MTSDAKPDRYGHLLHIYANLWAAYFARGVNEVRDPADKENVVGEDWRHQQYLSIGRDALRITVQALMNAERRPPETILDFPCGSGRVLRHLRAMFPHARIGACDLYAEHVDFCREHFGAVPFISKESLDELDIGVWDLIFCGSLLTHLPRKEYLAAIRFIIRSLSPDGVAIVTLEGRHSIYSQANKWKLIGDDLFDIAKNGYEKDGLGFVDYEADFRNKLFSSQESYGVTLTKPSWLTAQLEVENDIRILSYSEREWNDHQDVVVFAKPGVNAPVAKPRDDLHGPRSGRNGDAAGSSVHDGVDAWPISARGALPGRRFSVTAFVTHILEKWAVNSSRLHLERYNAAFAARIPAGALVLDAGAGSGPYRHLFAHARYESADFQQADMAYAAANYVCDLANIPVEDGRFDYVIFNQVLEHVPDPLAVLREIHRVLAPGGQIIRTTPLFYEEHLQPFDFYRYTQFAHQRLFREAGFAIESIEWMEGYLGTVAYQLDTAARYLPVLPSLVGRGWRGWLASPFVAMLKIYAALMAIGLYRLDCGAPYKGRGYPKNYVVLARKPKA